MKYDNLSSLEKYLEGTPFSNLSFLYLILGKDAFESQQVVQALLRFLITDSGMKDHILSVFEGSPQFDEQALWDVFNTGSFFVKWRVIWIQQADKLKKSVQEELEKRMASSAPHYLILTSSHWSKNHAIYKTAEKKGIVVELAEIKPWEKEKRLVEWVNKQATAVRKLISYSTCQALVKYSGTDSFLVAQEFEKLLCYCGEKKEIHLQDIEAICTKQSVESIWQLGELIFRRDTIAALHIMQSLLFNGQALLPLLRQIRSQFQTEYQICVLLAQGKQASDISQEFPYLKGQILEKRIQQARNYGLEACRRGLLTLDLTEARVKNSFTDEKILVELLIIQLTNQPH